MTEKNPVATPSKQWAAQSKTWDLVDTLWGGTAAMRSAGKVYLPQEPAETETAYFNRLERSVLTPMYPDTVKKLMGKIMRMPVVLEDDVPSGVIRYMNDVDAQGTDINEWTMRIGQSALNHGVTFILVDSPNVQEIEQARAEPVTRADAINGTMRPYAVHVKAPQLIGWKSKVQDGQVILTQARIVMISEEDSPENEFETITVERIHVWDIGRKRVYRKIEKKDTDSEEWILESDGTVDLDFIPLLPVYGYQHGFMVGHPPLLDVAYLNITHWQSDSDQRHILHVARVPMLFGSGLGDDERGDFQIQVGPNTMTRGPQGSDMKYVEHSGAGIEAGAFDLETLESRIAKLGLNMVIRRPTGDVTATSRALDQAETDSPLGMFARHLEAKLEDMLDLFALILDLGEDAGGSVTVFKDFTITQRDADDIKALADMRARSDISQQTYWLELKRRGLLNEDFDPDKEIDLLDLEFQDSEPGLTEEEANAANKVGDETEPADGHTHVLQANGFTNIVDGHRHSWEPTGSETSEDNGHKHRLRGIADGQSNSRQGQQDEGTAPAGQSGQVSSSTDSGGE
jgi:hypothetical protein